MPALGAIADPTAPGLALRGDGLVVAAELTGDPPRDEVTGRDAPCFGLGGILAEHDRLHVRRGDAGLEMITRVVAHHRKRRRPIEPLPIARQIHADLDRRAVTAR